MWKLKSAPSESAWDKKVGDAPSEVIGTYDKVGKPTIGIVQAQYKYHLFDDKPFHFGTDEDFTLSYDSVSESLKVQAGSVTSLEVSKEGGIEDMNAVDLTVSNDLTVSGNIIASSISSVDTHLANVSNPHTVTASQISMGTSDDVQFNNLTVSELQTNSVAGGLVLTPTYDTDGEISLNQTPPHLIIEDEQVSMSLRASGHDPHHTMSISVGGVGATFGKLRVLNADLELQDSMLIVDNITDGYSTIYCNGYIITPRAITWESGGSAATNTHLGSTSNPHSVTKGQLSLDTDDAVQFADLVLSGNLTVQGATTTVDTTVTVSDAMVINNAGTDVGLLVNSTSTGHMLQIQDSGTDALVVEDGGNVGIGTATPDYLLDVESTGTVACRVKSTDGSSFLYLDRFDVAQESAVAFRTNNSTKFAIGLDNVANEYFHIGSSAFGAKYLTVDSSGNVGIGTDSPDYALDVAGNVGVDQYITHNGDTDTYIDFQDNYVGMVANGKVLVNKDGNIGIGITDPDEALEVGNAGKIKVSGTTAEYSARTLILESNTQQKITATSDLDILYGGYLNLGDDVRVLSDGKVGIGTDEPSEELHIEAAIPTILFKSSNPAEDRETEIKYSSGDLHLNIGDDLGGTPTYESQLHLNDNGIIKLRTNNVDALYIDGSQNVGIGTTSPTSHLTIESAEGTNYYDDAANGQEGLGATLQLHGTSGGTGDFTQILFSNSGAGTSRIVNIDKGFGKTDLAFVVDDGDDGPGDDPEEAMRIIAGGNVGIGTDSPSYPLDVRKSLTASTYNVLASFMNTNDSTTVGGMIRIADYNSTSDTGYSTDVGYDSDGYGFIRANWSNANNAMRIQAHNGSSITDVATFVATGNVGINDTAPAEKLDVDGNINVTGVYKVDDTQVLDGTSLATAVQVPIASLNNANSASSSTFWRGDGTWVTPTNTTTTADVLSALSGDLGGNVTFGNQVDDTITIGGDLVVTGTTTTTHVETVSTTNGVVFEGGVADTNELTLKAGVVDSDFTVTMPTAAGTLARTADVAYSSAISEGNSGLVPSVGTSGHFLRHDGTFGIPAYTTNTDNQLTQEQVEDYVGGMLGGTETLITVTYQDATGDIDFVVDNDLSNYDNSSSGFITATLTQEQVEDYAGAVVATGGTKTGIAVTYQDGTGDMDFVVDDTTKLPLAGGAMTGAITTNSTFDGVDIATRDGVLTGTTTTANAALPKAGGTMSGALLMDSNNITNPTQVASGSDMYVMVSAEASGDRTLYLKAINSGSGDAFIIMAADLVTIPAISMGGNIDMDESDIENVAGLDIISGNNGLMFDGGDPIEGFIISDTLTGHNTNNIASTRSIKNYVDTFLPLGGGTLTGPIDWNVATTAYLLTLDDATTGLYKSTTGDLLEWHDTGAVRWSMDLGSGDTDYQDSRLDNIQRTGFADGGYISKVGNSGMPASPDAWELCTAGATKTYIDARTVNVWSGNTYGTRAGTVADWYCGNHSLGATIAAADFTKDILDISQFPFFICPVDVTITGVGYVGNTNTAQDWDLEWYVLTFANEGTAATTATMAGAKVTLSSPATDAMLRGFESGLSVSASAGDIVVYVIRANTGGATNKYLYINPVYSYTID